MKQGYIPQKDRKKILIISDDIRQSSGVGTVAREAIIHTAHRFNWVNIGGAIKHPEEGKRFDISKDTDNFAGIEDSNVVIYPVSGYGNPDILRSIINIEKPDALMMVTDPRYYVWLFQMESEIRKKMPIIYLNIWDSAPAPLYNVPFYEACDGLLAISKQTKLFNRICLEHSGKSYIDVDTGEKYEGTSETISTVMYVPHGLNTDYFKPLDKKDPSLNIFKQNLLKHKDYKFIILFNSRNIRRKQIPDLILAYKMFVDSSEESKKDSLLILHTQEQDEHGTDLRAVIEYLTPASEGYNVLVNDRRLSVPEMNYLYNIADITALNSSNEGWGLALTESLLTGTPILANSTGGMQDQIGFKDSDGKWYVPSKEIPSNHRGSLRKHGIWAYPVYPTSTSLQGSIPTPYIFDDRCESKDIAARLMEAYADKKAGILEIKGQQGREWAISEEVGFTGEIMGRRIIRGIEKTLEIFKPKPSFEIVNISEVKQRTLPHNLYY